MSEQLLREIADELGVSLLVEPSWALAARFKLPGGEYRYVRGCAFDLNGAGATEIANDKDWASFFLSNLGYPVPTGAAFFSERHALELASERTPAAAWAYASDLGLPVIVKPNSQGQGVGVSLATDQTRFFEAVADACREDKVFLVQAPCTGREFRIVILDGEVLSAYERRPLSVTGDGSSTIAELLASKVEALRDAGRAVKLQRSDPRVTALLRTHKLTLDTVPQLGARVRLLAAANLSAGGEAEDFTERIHPSWQRIASSVARDMNLRLVGIDLIANAPLTEIAGQYTILEVNASPGLNNYADTGVRQERRVRDIYRRVLSAMLSEVQAPPQR